MDKWDPEETLRLIERYGCTHTHMVPTQFHRMLQLPDDVRAKYDVSAMKWAIHAAAPCPIDVKQKMLDVVGPGDLGVLRGDRRRRHGRARPRSGCSSPAPSAACGRTARSRSSTTTASSVETGVPGTVWMKMGSGDFEYKGDKAKTNESHDADGFFTVGDVGYFNDAGYLFLCDRKSDMIIAGGVNIYPAEIEGEILAYPGVGDVAVFGIPDDDMGEQIKAVVEPSRGRRPRRRAAQRDHGSPRGPARQVQVAAHDRLRRGAAA